MRVEFDLPDGIVRAYEDRAVALGCSLEETLVAALSSINPYSPVVEWVRDRVAVLVSRGLCDAEIAGRLHMAVGTVAGHRRARGLRANPRYPANPD